jgi:hypothetical protein
MCSCKIIVINTRFNYFSTIYFKKDGGLRQLNNKITRCVYISRAYLLFALWCFERTCRRMLVVCCLFKDAVSIQTCFWSVKWSVLMNWNEWKCERLWPDLRSYRGIFLEILKATRNHNHVSPYPTETHTGHPTNKIRNLTGLDKFVQRDMNLGSWADELMGYGLYFSEFNRVKGRNLSSQRPDRLWGPPSLLGLFPRR